MKPALLVLRHEVYALVSRRSFWLFLFGVPLLACVIYGAAAYLNRPTPPAASAPAEPSASADASGSGAAAGPSGAEPTRPPLAAVQDLLAPAEELRPQGVIDRSGLLEHDTALARDEREWIFYADPAQAAADLRAGTIAGYFIVHPDYIATGRIESFTAEYNLMASSQVASVLVDALEIALFDDLETARVYSVPVTEVIEVDLSPTPAPRRDSGTILALAIPYAVTSLLMMSILGSATLLLNGLAEEKVNRTMETLLLSIRPREILLGKIAGLGLVGLFQTAVWGGIGFFLLRLSGQAFAVPDEYMLNPSVLAWGVVFFLLGYLLYASVMAAVGALVPGLREATQVTTVVSLPLMAPYFLLPALARSPDGWLATAFSLFPPTAPTGMLLRLSAGIVPAWQIVLSAALLALTCLLVIRLAARTFRAQTIMMGQKFGFKTVWKALTAR